MPRKVLSAVDVVAGIVFTAFRKVATAVIVTAFLVAGFTTSMLILIYNMAK